MREIVFLLEEPSAKALLESLLPRILTDCNISFRCIPFEGKQDLEKQLVRKIRSYNNDQARFIILRDQDSHPCCKQVKENLLKLCHETGRIGQCLVRIACRELESFYLADLRAVEQALGISGISKKQDSKKYRSPDGLGNPGRELKVLTRNRYEKVAGSRAIGRCLNIKYSRSPSFIQLIDGIERMEEDLLGSNT